MKAFSFPSQGSVSAASPHFLCEGQNRGVSHRQLARANLCWFLSTKRRYVAYHPNIIRVFGSFSASVRRTNRIMRSSNEYSKCRLLMHYKLWWMFPGAIRIYGKVRCNLSITMEVLLLQKEWGRRERSFTVSVSESAS